MKKLENVDPETVDTDPRIILRYTERSGKFDYEYSYYLLRDEDAAIWCYRSFCEEVSFEGKTIPAYWSGGTLIEFPIAALAWIVESIEEKFLQTESEGGLEKGEFTVSKNFDGEKLTVKRMFGLPGYGLVNHSRGAYEETTIQSLQKADFSDSMLFENGLLNDFKQLCGHEG